jgi:uncharacterized protein (TIGR00369 family)
LHRGRESAEIKASHPDRENSVREQADTTGVSSRTRTVEWADPMILAGQAGKASGIEFLEKIASGALPPAPIAALLDFRLAKVENGFAVFEFEPAEFHYNPIGVVHGAMAGMLLDSTMGCSIQSTLPTGMAYTTLEFKVNLVRAITIKSGLMRAEGRVVHTGARVATAEGKLIDAGGKIYAHGTTTCLIFSISGEGGSRS